MPKMRKWLNHSWHSSRVTLNQCCYAFIRPRTPLVYRYHVISRTHSHSAVFGYSPSGWMPGAPIARRHIVDFVDSWATSVLVGLNMHRAGGTDWGKTQFRFGNTVPKQWTLSGFVQHTTVLTQCTKTITRLVGNKKYCIWIKCLNVCHIFKRVLA